MLIYYNGWFLLQRLEICVYQGYIKGFEKCIIWPKKLEKDKQKLKRVNFGPKEIKYPNEDNASFYLPNSCTKYNLT
jgi:recombinational DNA repair protein RecT